MRLQTVGFVDVIMKEIQLTKGKVALIDDEDFERVNAFKWYASLESRGKKWYTIRREFIDGRIHKVRMHRFVLGLPPGLLKPGTVVDHINHDSLDNRRLNLEEITQDENMKRSPGWKRNGE